MSKDERYGVRDLTYSRWHRTLDDSLHWIDLDAVEYCSLCKEPLVLIELAHDIGQTFKATTVMTRLATRADLPAFLVFYLAAADGDGITRLRVRRVWPPDDTEFVMSPQEYEWWLSTFRGAHRCASPVGRSGMPLVRTA